MLSLCVVLLLTRKSPTAFCFLGHYPKWILAALRFSFPVAVVHSWFVGGEGIWSWKLFHGQDDGYAVGKTTLAVPSHYLLRALGNGFQQQMLCHLSRN